MKREGIEKEKEIDGLLKHPSLSLIGFTGMVEWNQPAPGVVERPSVPETSKSFFQRLSAYGVGFLLVLLLNTYR